MGRGRRKRLPIRRAVFDSGVIRVSAPPTRAQVRGKLDVEGNMSAVSERKKVLVVDDDEQYLKMTARLLRGAGYEVVTRSEGIGTSAAVTSERPDMVLIDLNMPGVDGDRLALLIQRSFAHRPLVVLHSGMNEKVFKERAVACGADGAIVKGLRPEQFLEQLASVFGHGAGAGVRDEPRG
jgi:CheY-like chemotaxis protein